MATYHPSGAQQPSHLPLRDEHRLHRLLFAVLQDGALTPDLLQGTEGIAGDVAVSNQRETKALLEDVRIWTKDVSHAEESMDHNGVGNSMDQLLSIIDGTRVPNGKSIGVLYAVLVMLLSSSLKDKLAVKVSEHDHRLAHIESLLNAPCNVPSVGLGGSSQGHRTSQPSRGGGFHTASLEHPPYDEFMN